MRLPQSCATRQRNCTHSGEKSDALKLEDIALDCDGAARNVLSPYKGDDPWILTRQSQDVKLRAFVADLASTTAMLFRKELHSTIATVANVLFSRQDLTRSKIREMLRSSARDRR